MNVTGAYRRRRIYAVVAIVAGWLAAVQPAVGQSAYRGSTDNGVLSFTLGSGTDDKTIPLVRDVTGIVDTSALITAPALGIPPFATATIPLAPVTGNIATLGPPPTFATVSRTPLPISLLYPLGFGLACNASTSAVIFGADAGNGDVKITALCSANAATSAPNPPGFGPASPGTIAVASSRASTDPYVVAALDDDMPAVATVNLIDNYLTDPSNAKLRLEAVAPPEALTLATTELHVWAVTNVPGMESLFDLRIKATSATDSLSVTFTNSLGLPAPITAADFTHPSAGIFELNPAKRSFDLAFDIPAGEFGSDEIGGAYGMTLDVFFEINSDVHGVPEPATGMLLAVAVAAQAFGRRHRNRAFSDAASPR